MPASSGGGGGAGKANVHDLSGNWVELDEIADDRDLLKRLDETEREAIALFDRFDDLLVDGSASVHVASLLLPAVQKVREAASTAAADFFLKLDGVSAADARALAYLKDAAEELEGLEILVHEIKGLGRSVDKSTPVLMFKIGEADDDGGDGRSAWDPLADYDFGGGDTSDF
ncbi:hypothetical protein [Albimonas pacifica]|uniref:Uncharacterized protein n=1 Tax=Albimonas pacifica TaxID=1114924 RepID=A0A1I3GV17_9RHOB|nr:hypothetical protein [Albimonas pacifica]SFI27216.1 hypothetical protein SAMN05216258_105350 [Albimonas pacifica]